VEESSSSSREEEANMEGERSEFLAERRRDLQGLADTNGIDWQGRLPDPAAEDDAYAVVVLSALLDVPIPAALNQATPTEALWRQALERQRLRPPDLRSLEAAED
jgi:hypothetical protein